MTLDEIQDQVLQLPMGDRSSSCPSPELDCPSSLTIRVQRG